MREGAGSCSLLSSFICALGQAGSFELNFFMYIFEKLPLEKVLMAEVFPVSFN